MVRITEEKTSSIYKQKTIKPLLEASPKVQETILRTVKQINKHDSRSQFLEYLINLALYITEKAPETPNISSETACFTEMVKILSKPEFIREFAPKADPLMAARLRGQQRKIELLYREDTPLSSEEVAKLLQMTRQGVDKRRQKGHLLGVCLGRRGYFYPSWQFQDGEVLAGLTKVLIALENVDNWTKLMFLKTADIRLEGKTPLECLQLGLVETVVKAALSYGKQTAA